MQHYQDPADPEDQVGDVDAEEPHASVPPSAAAHDSPSTPIRAPPPPTLPAQDHEQTEPIALEGEEVSPEEDDEMAPPRVTRALPPAPAAVPDVSSPPPPSRPAVNHSTRPESIKSSTLR